MENNMTPKKALEKIKKHRYLHTVATMGGYVEEETNVGRELKQECKTIDQALTELESLEEEVNDLNYSKELLLDKLDEQKQILEVLKNKKVDLGVLDCCETAKEYNENKQYTNVLALTETEFNLLKEVLL